MNDPRQRALHAVSAVLGIPPGTVTAAASLFDLPGFDSFAVVAVLERLESELDCEVPPERIVPEAFESIDSLAGLLAEVIEPSGGDSGDRHATSRPA